MNDITRWREAKKFVRAMLPMAAAVGKPGGYSIAARPDMYLIARTWPEHWRDWSLAQSSSAAWAWIVAARKLGWDASPEPKGE